MNKVSSRSPRQKAGCGESPRTLEETGSGQLPPFEIARQTDLGRPVLVPPRLFGKKYAGSVFEVYQALDRKCSDLTAERRDDDRAVMGVYLSTRSLARLAGVGQNTAIRALAILARERLVAYEELDGPAPRMIWCLWLFPAPFEAAEFDMPLGRRARFEGEALVLVEADEGPAPSPARGAPDLAPRYSKSENKEKYDKRGSSSKLRPGGRKPGNHDAPPAPPLDPAILEFLAAEVEDEDAREDLTRAFPDLLGMSFPVARVFEAIEEAIGRDRDEKAEKIESLAAYAKGVMRRWLKSGRITRKYGKPSGAAIRPAPAVNQPRPEDAAARRSEARATAERDRIRRERWAALDPEERAAIEARFEVDCPAAESEPPMIRKGRRVAYCLEAMDDREA